MMKKSEASRTFLLAGGLVEKLGEGCRSKQEKKSKNRKTWCCAEIEKQ